MCTRHPGQHSPPAPGRRFEPHDGGHTSMWYTHRSTCHHTLSTSCLLQQSKADALFMDEIMLCMAPGHVTAHHALLLQAHGAALSHHICSMSFLGSYVTQSSLTCHQHTFSSHSCAWTSSHIAGMLQTVIEASNTVHGINTFAWHHVYSHWRSCCSARCC